MSCLHQIPSHGPAPAPPTHLKLLLVAILPLVTAALQALQLLPEVPGCDGGIPTAVELS